MNVKELLLKQNIDDVIQYMKKHFITEFDDRVIKEKRFEENFPLSFIDIEKTTPVKTDNVFIFGYKGLDLDDDLNIESNPEFFCFQKDELENVNFNQEINLLEDIKEANLPPSYGLMFINWEDILGYNIVPFFEQISELELACLLLWELTWFGYTKDEYNYNSSIHSEELDKCSEEAKQALEEGRDDYFISFEDLKEELFETVYSDLTEEEKEEQRRLEELHLQEYLEKSKVLAVEHTKNVLEIFKQIEV